MLTLNNDATASLNKNLPVDGEGMELNLSTTKKEGNPQRIDGEDETLQMQ